MSKVTWGKGYYSQNECMRDMGEELGRKVNVDRSNLFIFGAPDLTSRHLWVFCVSFGTESILNPS